MPRPLAHPNLQSRSQLTGERILAATEALLAERGIDQLTVEDIAARAHVSVGAFYKRFQGKASLLPILLERVQTRQLQRLHEFRQQPQWRNADLQVCLQAILQAIGQAQLEQRELLRALLAGALAEAPPAGIDNPRTRELMQLLYDWLIEHASQMHHPQPRLALRIGLAGVLHTLQAAVLTQRLPPDLPLTTLTAELARMLCRYLEAEWRETIAVPAAETNR